MILVSKIHIVTHQTLLDLNSNYCPGWSYLKFIKGKGKFSLEQAMKAQRGSRGITLLFP
jgi:hypothetical protein